MPFANEHSCRLISPDEFVRFRRDNSKDPNVIIGFREDGSSDAQAFRYPIDTWTESRAHDHCSDHDGAFEPASTSASRKKDENYETRSRAGALEIRNPDNHPPMLVGTAAVFNAESEERWGFREIIRPGAFRRTLAEQADVRALLNHDPNRIIGRSRAGTLRLHEDNAGLQAEIDIPDTTVGHDVAESVRRGDLDGMSFGFIVKTEAWSETEAGGGLREIRDVDLYDVSVVAFPAYPDTRVALRSLEQWRASTRRQSLKNLEMRLRLTEISSDIQYQR